MVAKKQPVKPRRNTDRATVKPHRPFRLTRRRDSRRPLKIPGYIGFTVEVAQRLWRRKWLFGGLALLYALSVIIVGGMSTQDNYIQIQDLVTETTVVAADNSTKMSSLSSAGLVLLSSIGGDGTLSDVQQIYLALALLLVWLTTVWLLRELFAGRSPRLRDGLYNAGSPIVSTILVAFMLLLQLIPLALTAVAYAGLVSVGLANQGFGAMLAVLVLAVVVALTLYWLTSSFIALVVVTLPGMYPVQAMRAASGLVVSRRSRVMYRFLWMTLVVLLVWVIVMVPMILLESWLRGQWIWLSAVPTIPFLITLMSSVSSIWTAAYIYLLYRKLVDDDSLPG